MCWFKMYNLISGVKSKMQNVKCKKHNISLNVKFECWFSIHFTFIYYYKMLQIDELRIDQYIILDFFSNDDDGNVWEAILVDIPQVTLMTITVTWWHMLIWLLSVFDWSWCRTGPHWSWYWSRSTNTRTTTWPTWMTSMGSVLTNHDRCWTWSW